MLTATNIILLIVMWIYCVIIIFQSFQYKKRVAEFLKEERNVAEQLLEKTKKELTLKKILLNAKQTKENYFETLEKIEKELFKDNNSSKDF